MIRSGSGVCTNISSESNINSDSNSSNTVVREV